uniref:Outer envelope pore protein 21, chloroplastic n=2 Tax=Setaria italica TaxID=4555 RepID=K3YVG0_SETIT
MGPGLGGPNVSASSSSLSRRPTTGVTGGSSHQPASHPAAASRLLSSAVLAVSRLPLPLPPQAALLMETSLRLRGGGGLRIHAKEKLALGHNSLLQAHGEIDAGAAAPSYLALFVRQFYPQIAANIGVGVQFHKGQRLTYNLRAKKALPFTSDGLLGLNLKARLLTDTEFNPRKRTGAVELAWTILDFRKGQDVRLKLGYELYGKVPYLQLRENNWTLNAYMDGKWDVRFDM